MWYIGDELPEWVSIPIGTMFTLTQFMEPPEIYVWTGVWEKMAAMCGWENRS